MMFKVANFPTFYRIENVGAIEALDVGCPEATHKIIGKYETTYGMIRYTGRPKGAQVHVPELPRHTRGARIVFTGGDEPIDGYLIG
jgi:hypothetical protein